MILAQAAKVLPIHWQAQYGIRPVLLETFVEKPRFLGTCYRAANWIYLSQTQGRGKLGPAGKQSVPFKDDGFAKKGKSPVLSFRAQREISRITKRFLVALLLEMTEIDFLRNHHNRLWIQEKIALIMRCGQAAGKEQMFSSIVTNFFLSLASMVSQNHKHDFIFTIDLIKEPVRTNSVPPCWSVPVSQKIPSSVAHPWIKMFLK